MFERSGQADQINLIRPHVAMRLVPSQGGPDETGSFVVADIFGGGTKRSCGTVLNLDEMNYGAALGHDIDFTPTVAPVAV
jgi:hypothetical protein